MVCITLNRYEVTTNWKKIASESFFFQFFINFLHSSFHYQVYPNRPSSPIRPLLPKDEHFSAAVIRMGLLIIHNDATIVRYMGTTRLRWINILLHNTQKRWQIHQEIPVSRWLSSTLYRNHHIIFLHLLHRTTPTKSAKQACTIKTCRFTIVSWTWRQSPYRYDVDHFHLLFALLFTADHCEFVRWQTQLSIVEYNCVGVGMGIECNKSIYLCRIESNVSSGLFQIICGYEILGWTTESNAK